MQRPIVFLLFFERNGQETNLVNFETNFDIKLNMYCILGCTHTLFELKKTQRHGPKWEVQDKKKSGTLPSYSGNMLHLLNFRSFPSHTIYIKRWTNVEGLIIYLNTPITTWLTNYTKSRTDEWRMVGNIFQHPSYVNVRHSSYKGCKMTRLLHPPQRCTKLVRLIYLKQFGFTPSMFYHRPFYLALVHVGAALRSPWH